MRLFRPRFNQRQGTPDSELKTNPVRHYASCDCLVPQYESDCLDEQDGHHESVRWQDLLLHTEVQEISSDAWKSLEAYISKVRADDDDELNPEEFDPYTSRCLHWFPYEITRCKNLKRSRVSTRCLYGNYKYRPPFPRLPQVAAALTPIACSVCGGPFFQQGPLQAWISLRVATDVLPLLVHACSHTCIKNLPKPADGYVQGPHQGGLDVEQPPRSF